MDCGMAQQTTPTLLTGYRTHMIRSVRPTYVQLRTIRRIERLLKSIYCLAILEWVPCCNTTPTHQPAIQLFHTEAATHVYWIPITVRPIWYMTGVLLLLLLRWRIGGRISQEQIGLSFPIDLFGCAWLGHWLNAIHFYIAIRSVEVNAMPRDCWDTRSSVLGLLEFFFKKHILCHFICRSNCKIFTFYRHHISQFYNTILINSRVPEYWFNAGLNV